MKKKFFVFSISLCAHSFYVTAQHWDSLASGFNNAVRTLYADTANNILYAGGNFIYAGKVKVNSIAQWNGTKWDSLGTGLEAWSPVLSITKYNNAIYAGGAFSKGIAKWNDSKWASVGSGINGEVIQLNIFNGELYACGGFDTAGGTPISNIAKW